MLEHRATTDCEQKRSSDYTRLMDVDSKLSDLSPASRLVYISSFEAIDSFLIEVKCLSRMTLRPGKTENHIFDILRCVVKKDG